MAGGGSVISVEAFNLWRFFYIWTSHSSGYGISVVLLVPVDVCQLGYP